MRTSIAPTSVALAAAACAAMIALFGGCASSSPPLPSATDNHLNARGEVRAPFLLVHGFSGYRDIPVMGGYFNAVADRLREDGARVFVPALPPYSSTEARAAFLAKAIDEALAKTGAKRVHLLAHSQGGIDSRYVIQDLAYEAKVETLTTIATPHRGSPVLDVVSFLPGFVSWPLFGSLAWALDSAQGEATGEADVDGAFDAMHPLAMLAFNTAHPVPKTTAAFSIAGVTGPDLDACKQAAWGAPRFWDAPDFRVVPTWAFIRGDPSAPRANDGVVPVDSAIWATFLGCLPADHFDQMGNGAEVFASDEAGVLDHLTFFASFADRLRAYEDTHDQAVVTAPLPLPQL